MKKTKQNVKTPNLKRLSTRVSKDIDLVERLFKTMDIVERSIPEDCQEDYADFIQDVREHLNNVVSDLEQVSIGLDELHNEEN